MITDTLQLSGRRTTMIFVRIDRASWYAFADYIWPHQPDGLNHQEIERLYHSVPSLWQPISSKQFANVIAAMLHTSKHP